MDLTAGVVVADRFRLVRPLGQGGMGAVWEAQHTALDTPCALKFIHEEAARSTELRARFEREAKAAAQLRSPHVVQILDHGLWEGRAYIAMELLEGEDLAKRLRKRRPLEAREVVAIAAQVGRALTKAHAAGLVHRDLKPANIFLVRDDDREIAKVLDFGVAKTTTVSATMTSDAETKTGAILGTPFYMSPEQARGNKDIDHRADLWALSVVVFQCITGKLPFRSDALGDLLVKIITEPPPVPSSVAPSLPPSFDAWWARASARDITQRFQTAKELTDALGMALDVTVPGVSEVGTSIAIPVAQVAAPPPAAEEPEPVPDALLGTGTRTPGASISGVGDPLQNSLVLPKNRSPLVAAAVAALVFLGGIGAVAALRSSPGPTPAQPGASTPAPAEPPVHATNVVATTTAPVPATATATSAAASATASAAASATHHAAPPTAPAAHASPAPHAAPGPAHPAPTNAPEPAPTGKPRVDFGI